jgi:hypothetical protein
VAHALRFFRATQKMMEARTRVPSNLDPFSALPPGHRMYYDDEARRFNFVSGLLLGGVLGAGLALAASPRRRSRQTRHLRSGLQRVKSEAGSGTSLLREGLAGALSAAVEMARERGRV